MVLHNEFVANGRRLAAAVKEKRLWDRHGEMAAFGARDDGGVNRQALSHEDGLARLLLKGWAEEAGYTCFVDPIGNFFVRREGIDPSLSPILTGSHLDSQPAGGRFDGASGVLAGLEALQAMDAVGIETRRAIEVVSWTNEEGSRFAPGVMGSSVFAGQSNLADVLPVRDSKGIKLKDALTDLMSMMETVERRKIGFPVGAYVELHIEQGPILENSGATIGVVTGIQGTKWFEIEVVGAEAHAGTTPSRMRKDALKAAVSIIAAIEEKLADDADVLRFTVGRISVEPNSPNTVPARVVFSVDLRHPDAATLKSASEAIQAVCRGYSGSCSISVRETVDMDPISFDADLVDLLDKAAGALALPSKRLISGAFHDAKSMHAVSPSAMVFIPCAGGVSHNPNESATAADIAAGARVLALTLATLANAANDRFKE
jgi:beta-ureidopropionase / N-carbamoyl-L-amino-acid hydrolase